MGWLLVTINASDVAASGAEPTAFLAALEMPGSLPVAELHRYLAGVRDSCAANGLKYVGGNLREAALVGGVGTAIGTSLTAPLTRRGARPGDKLVVFGDGGRFWADVERLRLGHTIEPTLSPVFSPVSQSRVMHHLHREGLLACAMDTSDGLAPALEELVEKNHLRLRVSLETMRGAHRELSERPERFWMGWGDWTVVAAVRPENIAKALKRVTVLNHTMTVVGEFFDGAPEVVLATASSELPLPRLESECFAADSWFSKGVEEYRRLLHQMTLPEL